MRKVCAGQAARAAAPSIHSPGSTRRSLRFSSDRRSGPGRISQGAAGAITPVEDQDRVCRSRVGSPLTSMNCVRVGHRIEGDDEIVRQLQRDQRLLARRKFDGFDGEFLSRLSLDVSRQVDTRAPDNLPQIFRLRQGVGIVRGDRRTRGLTVKVTSTISSSVGS